MYASASLMKQVLLSLIFLFFLFLLLQIPSYRQWHHNTILGGYADVAAFYRHPSAGTRKLYRYGDIIRVYADLRKKNDSITGEKNIRMLIPSNAYLKEKSASFVLEEPSVIYYKSGLSTVLPYTTLSLEAGTALVWQSGTYNVIALTDQQMKDSLIQLYRSYPKTSY